MSTYISLINETEFTGNVNATSLTLVGEVDFTEATPIIGLADNVTLELITNPVSLLLKNILQVKDGGITNVKIVTMDSNKLTGHITINGVPNIVFDIALDMSNNSLLNVGNIVPYDDGVVSLGNFLKRFITVYSEIGDFSLKVNTPTIDNSLGVELQYNSNTVLRTTIYGINVLGDVIFNSSSISTTGNIYPMLDSAGLLGIPTNRWLSVYTRAIDSTDGFALKYNNSTKLFINTADVTNYVSIIPSTDITYNLGSTSNRFNILYSKYIDSSNGFILRYNGNSRLSIDNTQLTNYVSIIPSADITYNLGSIASRFNNLFIKIIDSSNGTDFKYNGTTILQTTSTALVATTNIEPLSSSLYNIGSATRLWNYVYGRYFDYPSGVNLMYNGSIRLTTTSTGINLNFGMTGLNDALYVGGTTVKNKKLVLYDNGNGDGEHNFYGMGVNNGVFRLQNPAGASFVFYVSVNSTTSTEIYRINSTNTISYVPLIISGSQTITINATTNTISTSGSSLALNSALVRFQGTIDNNTDNTYDIGVINSNRFRTIYLGTSCYTPTINNSTSVSLQYNSSTKLSTSNAGVLMAGIIDMNNNIITNASTISSQVSSVLTLSGDTNVVLNIATGVLNSVFIGGQQVKNKKLVLYTNDYTSEHEFYGFGINGGILRYQTPTAAGHKFYCGLTTTTSQEVFSIYNNGLTALRSLNMSSNDISNVNTLGVTTINATTINSTNTIITGTTKTAGLVCGHRTITNNQTLTETDYFVSVQTSSGAITITLPLISGLTYSTGRNWKIKDISGLASRNNITINTSSPNLLDGSSTLVINANYSSISIYSDGTNYYIF